MAVDTANKRYSMFGFGAPARLVMPEPDGGFSTQADRQHVVYLYSGLEADEPVVSPDAPVSRTTFLITRTGRRMFQV
jgi:hypothetical protein